MKKMRLSFGSQEWKLNGMCLPWTHSGLWLVWTRHHRSFTRAHPTVSLMQCFSLSWWLDPYRVIVRFNTYFHAMVSHSARNICKLVFGGSCSEVCGVSTMHLMYEASGRYNPRSLWICFALRLQYCQWSPPMLSPLFAPRGLLKIGWRQEATLQDSDSCLRPLKCVITGHVRAGALFNYINQLSQWCATSLPASLQTLSSVFNQWSQLIWWFFYSVFRILTLL